MKRYTLLQEIYRNRRRPFPATSVKTCLTTFCLIFTLLLSGFAGTAITTAAEATPQDNTSAESASDNGTTKATGNSKQLDIMFLHDTHSHLNSFLSNVDGETKLVGGFSRIKTLIDAQKAENPDTLIVDAGDFSMGTLVQSIFATDSSELRMLGNLGVVATTLGNHEFDYRTEGLAGSLHAAADSGDPVPAIVVSNIDWDTMAAEGLTEEQQQLKDALEYYGYKEYMVVTKGDIKIAIMGIFGADALECAPMCVLKFEDAATAAAETVAEIQANEDVDMIVCLSHSGTWSNLEKSEDEQLALAVPEIDLIVSGHTHTFLKEPIVHGDTYIVSVGEYGKHLGSLSMTRQADGSWSMDSYELLPITAEIPQNTDTQAKVDSFMEKVDANYLADFGYSRDRVLAENAVSFVNSDLLGRVHTEHNLGNILSDSFVYAVENADTGDSNPVDVAVVPSGCVRDSLIMGAITVEDAYNAYSLGIGPDGKAGYPLISVYLTGEELKIAAEIDASISDLMTTARLYMSGMHFSYNPNRLILNKVTDCYLSDNGNRVEIENDKLYRVVCDLYSGQMLGSVTDLSFGLLSIQPKFADGTIIENIEDAIIMDGDVELKAWAAVASYLDSFEDTDADGISDVPESYANVQGRKVVEDSKKIGDLIKAPNKYAVMIVAVLLVAVAIVVGIVVLMVKVIKSLCRKNRKANGSKP